MLYIILIVNLATQDASYCTKPDTLVNTQSALSETLHWYKTHRGYGPATIINSSDPRYTRAIDGYIYDDAVRGKVAVPPCRLLGSD
jgi:hypothetical protein